MSIVKSFSVENGDLFYISHGSDNFTIIDCNLLDTLPNHDDILEELENEKKMKGISRFISTHPDEDHISGINKLVIDNFYCVKNEASKEEKSESFKSYCELRNSEKAFYLEKGVRRRFLNDSNEERGSSGITVLWPNVVNEYYKEVLEKVKEGAEHNNLSPVLQYSIENGPTYLWLGDIMSDFLEKVKGDINFQRATIVFAPHHGRSSGKIPTDILEIITPKLIIVGEAPSKDLEYYKDYPTITQNSSGDIVFQNEDEHLHIFVSKESYLTSTSKPKLEIFQNKKNVTLKGCKYLGSLKF